MKGWTFVDGDDWVALYNSEGKLVTEGHSISTEDFLDYFNVHYRSGVDQEWLITKGNFPKKLSQVKFL